MKPLNLTLLSDRFAVCRLEPGESIPTWAMTGNFISITRTREELSLVCLQSQVPAGIQAERGWRAFKVAGPLDFALVGILADLSGALARANISLFAISTFDTDYILVREADVSSAMNALRQAGHSVTEE